MLQKSLAVTLVIGVAVCMFILTQSGEVQGRRPSWSHHFISKKDIPKGPASIGAGEDLQARDRYEWLRLRDPATGSLPAAIRERELVFSRKHPTSMDRLRKGGTYSRAEYTWTFRGPVNIGGRTRALGVDINNPLTLLAGGVSGGMWGSLNGGTSWQKRPVADGSQSATCLVQDRRPGRTSRWYYGTGELRGNSASGGGGSLYRGDGIYTSTDNGTSWTKLASTSTDSVEFDQAFDYVWNIALSPTDTSRDVVVAATIGTIQRSTDGGLSWTIAMGTLTNDAGPRYTDVTVSPSGVFYATCSSRDMRLQLTAQDNGIWRSPDGITWTNITPIGWPSDYSRIVSAVSPSNANIVYFLAETPGFGTNGHSLWKYTYVSGNGAGPGGLWENRSANLPDEDGKTGNAKFDSQISYNLVAAVHPLDPNVLFIGGVNLYRSDNAFVTAGSYKRIGGYFNKDTYARYPNNHPDHHALVSDPVNPLVLYNGNDGGVFKTFNCLADSVLWTPLNNGYYTTQFYSVATDPGTLGDVTVMGGMQDNGTWISSSQNEFAPWEEVSGGDGGFCAIGSGGNVGYISFYGGTTYRFTNTTGGRIDPSGGNNYLFISPYTLDAVDDNIMYFAAGQSVWRNSNLSGIPMGSTNPTSVNWSIIANAGPGVSVTALATSTHPANVLYYGTTNGGIFRAAGANAGTPISANVSSGKGMPTSAYVSSIAVDPYDANKVLIAFSNYSVQSVFQTSDGGGSWQNVSGNLEEFPNGSGNGPSVRWVAMLPDTEKYYYFAATSTGLYATRDFAGTSTVWTRESSLGTAVVDMLSIRSVDGFVTVGTHGSGVFSAFINVVAPPEPPAPPSEVPATIAVSPNYPNPFNPGTSILIKVSRPMPVRALIVDLAGREIATIYDGTMMVDAPAVSWDGRDSRGVHVASGVYIVVAQSANRQSARKIMVLR